MSESGDIWTAWAFSFFVHMFLDPINQSQSAASSFLEENVGFCLLSGIFLGPTDCSQKGFVLLKYFQVMPSSLSL